MSDNTRLDDLRRRVLNDPASIAFAQLAEEYRRAGSYQEAVDACHRGLAVHPTYLSARVTLGRALTQLGQLDEAESELQGVLRNAPQNLAAIRGLGDVHFKRGALPEAIALYRTALSLTPNDPELERTVADLSLTLARTLRTPEQDRAASLVAALDRWLDALHVTRAQRSA